MGLSDCNNHFFCRAQLPLLAKYVEKEALLTLAVFVESLDLFLMLSTFSFLQVMQTTYEIFCLSKISQL